MNIAQRPADLIKSESLVNHARPVKIVQSPPDLIKYVRVVFFARLVNIPQSLLSYKALRCLVTI
jgi:hypothetical protein